MHSFCPSLCLLLESDSEDRRCVLRMVEQNREAFIQDLSLSCGFLLCGRINHCMVEPLLLGVFVIRCLCKFSLSPAHYFLFTLSFLFCNSCTFEHCDSLCFLEALAFLHTAPSVIHSVFCLGPHPVFSSISDPVAALSAHHTAVSTQNAAHSAVLLFCSYFPPGTQLQKGSGSLVHRL